jgi:uncharacterized protein (TIGR02001 family)
MKTLKIALCAATASLAFASVALAEGMAAPTISYNAAITSDYVFRGISQTKGKPAVSGGIDAASGMVYAGAWLSNVDFGPTLGDPENKTNLEYDLYAGVKPVLEGINLDIAVIRYGYASSPSAANYAYWEGKIAASKAIGNATVGGVFYYSPEFFGETGNAYYYEANGAYALPNKLTVSGALGYQDLEKSKAGINGYTTWNLGLAYPLSDHISIDVRYSGTDSKAKDFYTDKFAGDRFAASLKAAF